ncbi:MAG: sugar ABC transporter permease, partial [Verrucomicrobia bacterium]|nr:sugar ABC transporter permease [Verrucomicrobiota bacterium]
MTRLQKRQLLTGLLFVSPWVAGFLAFSLYPFLASAYFSACDYSVLSPAVWVGPDNYLTLARDTIFWQAVWNTLFFAAVSIPLGLLMSLTLAILLNFNVPGIGIFRTIFFLPS